MSKLFKISANNELSIAQLKQKKQQGYSVLRSAHIGNQYPSNLALAFAEIPTLLVDKTTIEKDKNYKPGDKIVGGTNQSITETKNGLTILQTKADPSHITNPGIGCLHIESFKKLFPNTNIFSDSEFFINNIQIIDEILKGVLKVLLNNEEYDITLVFDRYLINGKIEKIKKIGNGYLIESTGELISIKNLIENFNILNLNIFKLLDPQTTYKQFLDIKNSINGPIISNDFNVVLTEVVNCLNTKKDILYHCSGPDFVNYCMAKTDLYEKIFTLIKQQLSLELPNSLELIIIPSALLKLISTSGKTTQQIAQLFQSQEQKLLLEDQKRIAIKQAQEKGESIYETIGIFGEKQKQLNEKNATQIAQLLSTISPKYLFGHIKNCCEYFTQYDLTGLDKQQLNEIFNPIMSLTPAQSQQVLSMIKKGK